MGANTITDDTSILFDGDVAGEADLGTHEVWLLVSFKEYLSAQTSITASILYEVACPDALTSSSLVTPIEPLSVYDVNLG